jgi:putative glutamine amidotransferase
MSEKRPIIGCTTYRKRVPQRRPIEIYGLMPSYVEAIVAGGGIPLLIPLGLSTEDMQAVLERIDGLVLPGGGDVEPELYGGQRHDTLWGINPERDHTELFMSRLAVKTQKPILAICRGIQVFNVALGGTLWEDIASLVPGAIRHDAPDDRPRNYLAHSVKLERNSLLAQHLGQGQHQVNSIHHQAIRELAPELVVTATAPDEIIEGVELPGHPFAIGVQWHPENLVGDNPAMLALFKGLVQASTH